MKPEGSDTLQYEGIKFIKFSKEKFEKTKPKESKSKIIFEFLERNRDKAFFSKEIAEVLSDKGVKPCDVMTTVRRLESKGLIYVRGYRTGYGETPFKEGFLITLTDSSKPREKAIGGCSKN
ncbi:MAG: hypothetical protein QXX95_02655 [Nitrososphaerales archaeon]